jgi:hypothetical protein
MLNSNPNTMCTAARVFGVRVPAAFILLALMVTPGSAASASPTPSASPSPQTASSGADIPDGAKIAIALIVIGFIIAGITGCCMYKRGKCSRRPVGGLGGVHQSPAPAKVAFPFSTGAVPANLPFAPDYTLRWALLAPGKSYRWPRDAIALGDSNGCPEYLARARLGDGSLRPGRVSLSETFNDGCRVACEC